MRGLSELMRIEEGWLSAVQRVPSPNCDPRPPGASIDLLVIHSISLPPGEFGGPWVDRLFTNQLDPAVHPYFAEIAGLEVSSHLFIRRSGELVQYVPFDLRAWHAGASCWEGRERCNDYSIGIELEGSDELAFEEVQYRRLLEVTQLLMKQYPAITPTRVVGHCDIAPGRKSDPGPGFDWARYRDQLTRALA
jgi:AmpD protein